MNESFAAPIAAPVAAALISDLRAFAGVCEEVLTLAQRERETLASEAEFKHQEFAQRREQLLPTIKSLLQKFRHHREMWGKVPQAQRDRFQELKRAFQNIQNLLMKIIVLDRENQQALLRRGLVPLGHLPAEGVRAPHCVADLYRKNSLART